MRERMREWITKIFSLPPEVVHDIPRIEMIGSYRLQVENHLGVEHFSGEEIRVKTHSATLKITGKDLRIRMINLERVCIEGEIQMVNL